MTTLLTAAKIAEWRKLAAFGIACRSQTAIDHQSNLRKALRAACDRVDELLERAEAAEARLAVAVEALEYFANQRRGSWDMTVADKALAKLKGEP